MVKPRLVHVRFNSDSDRQPSKRDPALRTISDILYRGKSASFFADPSLKVV
jgi:hypothetical protein